MAELIDKGATLVDMNALLEELEDYIEYDTFDQYKEEPLINMSFETLEDVITSQPTTTEAEIRAKAYDRFAEKLGILCENSAMALDRYNGRPLYNKDGKWHDLINDVAEQLKEE